MSDLENKVVIDAEGRVYKITHHHLEADELQLKRGDTTTAITLHDVQTGSYEIYDTACCGCGDVIEPGYPCEVCNTVKGEYIV
jgi:hypothetical protein